MNDNSDPNGNETEQTSGENLEDKGSAPEATHVRQNAKENQ